MTNERGAGLARALGTIWAACVLVASGCAAKKSDEGVSAAQAEEYRSLAARAEAAIAAAGFQIRKSSLAFPLNRCRARRSRRVSRKTRGIRFSFATFTRM